MQFLKRLKPMVSPVQNSAANTIYVDSDTEEVKVGTGASGSTERIMLSMASSSATWLVDSNGHLVPAATATYSLGSASLEAGNLYTRFVGTGSSNSIGFFTGGSTKWVINTSGNFLASNDNSYDIGAAGASRPRNIFSGSAIRSGADFNCADASAFFWNSRSSITSSADGLIELKNNAGTAFTRLCFGGTTGSFPAIVRSASSFLIQTADGGGTYTGLSAGVLTGAAGTATPAGGSSSAVLYLGSANYGIFFGSGAPTVSAAQGSLYIRSDGSSTSTRLYVNTNGSTTWTNVTTAA